MPRLLHPLFTPSPAQLKIRMLINGMQCAYAPSRRPRRIIEEAGKGELGSGRRAAWGWGA
eukprot:2755089-Rhodomonas_salina.1